MPRISRRGWGLIIQLAAHCTAWAVLFKLAGVAMERAS
jgi:hypothetical protein